uniref:Uncharacterized protein n=1 Tax=Arundo donax TaxID=35708 RepID=A0A0A8YRL3_ARUDO
MPIPPQGQPCLLWTWEVKECKILWQKNMGEFLHILQWKSTWGTFRL